MMTATYSPEDNKLRLYSSSTRLDAETYARVKAAGFSWAPKQELFVAPMWTPSRADLCIELCGQIDDEDTSLVDRAAERAERFEDYHEARKDDAHSAHAAVSRIADGIPLGQPILVGHHSERRARKDAERIENGMRRAVQMWETAQYWKSRAAGALRHAKYKEDPGVRHRRIKGLEADARKQQKTIDEATKLHAAWSIEGLTLDAAKHIANHSGGYWSQCFPLADFPRDPPASQYEGPMGLWSALDGGVITAEQGRAIALRIYPATIAHAQRWLDHITNRIAYERAMLGESGGLAADAFDLQPGGVVRTTRGRRQVIVRVNRKDDRVLSVSVAGQSWTVGIEEIVGYEPPTETAAAAVASAVKLAPICNYPSEGCATMTQAEWAAIYKDTKGTRTIAATEAQEKHRRRTVPGYVGVKYGAPRGDQWGYAWVYISDAKRTDPADPRAPAKAARKSVARKIAEAAGVADTDTSEAPATAAPSLREVLAEATAPTLAEVHNEVERLKARNEARAERDAEAAPFAEMSKSLKAGVQIVAAPQLFPTPPDLAARMVRLCGIEAGETVLEPSGGTGRLIQAVIDSVDTEIVSYEVDPRLCAALTRTFPSYKLQVRCRDFLAVTEGLGQFPRIVMNPPFAKGADVDHVTHALRFLAPGGRLVAVMSAGIAFREDRKSRDFRELVTRLRGRIEPLPADTFVCSGTGVSTVLVTLIGGEANELRTAGQLLRSAVA